MGDARPLLDEELHDLVRDAVADVSSAARSLDLGSTHPVGAPAALGERRAGPQATILPLPAGQPAAATEPASAATATLILDPGHQQASGEPIPVLPSSRPPRAFLARLEVASAVPEVRHPVRTRRVAVACHRASTLDVRRASRMLRIAVPVVSLGPPSAVRLLVSPAQAAPEQVVAAPASVAVVAPPVPVQVAISPTVAAPEAVAPQPAAPAGLPPPPEAGAQAASPLWRAAAGHATNLAIAAALELVTIFCAIMVGLVVTGHHLEQVITGSMQPTIPIGSLVLAERIPVSQLQVGDIMVFPNPDNAKETIVHRIIWLSHDQQGDVLVKTKGDYNALPDNWTISRAASAEADRVTLVIPGAGTLAAWLQTVGIWGLVVLVAGAVGWYGVRKARSILAESDEDQEPTTVGGGT